MPPSAVPSVHNHDTPTQADHDVAVVILNWNAAEDTLGCLARVATWHSVRPHVWVVDNASDASDMARLTAGLPDSGVATTLIANDENRGFAGGCNVGIAAALAAGDAPILLLNNDATLDDAGIGQLMATLAAHPHALMVGPALYHGDTLLNAGHRNLARQVHTSIAALPAGAVGTVDYVSGSVALVNPAALHVVGLLDEEYFFSGEVADLCRRGQAAGYVTLVDGRVRAEHDVDRSYALRNTLYTYYVVRNRLRYARKFESRLRVAGWAAYSALLAGKLALQGDHPAATAVRLGLTDALTGCWGGQNARVLAACRPRGAVR